MIKKILNRNKGNYSLPLIGFIFSVFVLTILINFTADLPDSKLGQAALPYCVPDYTSCDAGWIFQHYTNCDGERTENCGLGLCSGGECVEEEPDTGECTSDSQCNDGDSCTTDKCREAGQPSSFCENFWNNTCDDGDGDGDTTPPPVTCTAVEYNNGICAKVAGGNLRGGDCKVASSLGGTGTAKINVLDSGSGRMHIIWNLFHSDIAGCASYNQSAGTIGFRNGTCDFDAPHQSGTCTVGFDITQHNCGRVQYDAAFSGGGGLFMGAMVDYGVDCADAPPIEESPTPTPTPPPGNNPPGGFLDLVNCELIYGWAQDPDSPNTPVTVEIWIDGPRGSGQLYQTLTANISRENGNVGYSYEFPPEKIDGLVHSVYTYAIDNEVPSVATLLTNSGITMDTATCLDPCALVALDAQFSEDLTSSNLATSVSAIGTGDVGSIRVCYDYPPSASECTDITSSGFHQRLWPRSDTQFTVSTTVEAYASNEELCESAEHTFIVLPTELTPCELLDFNVDFDSTLGSDELTTDVTASWSGGDPVVEICYTPYYPDTSGPQIECFDIPDDGHDQRIWNRFTENYDISTSVSATVAGELCETAAFSYNVPGANATPTPTPIITPTPTATPVPTYKLTKFVRNESLNDPIFRFETEASPEDIVEFSVWVRGTSGIVKNLRLYDILPEGLELIPGTVRISGHNEESGNLFLSGNRLYLGDLAAGGRISILFKARVAIEDFFPEGRTTLVNEIRLTSSNAPPQTTTARVIVERVGPGDIKTGPPRNFYGPFIFDRDSYKREAYTLPIDTLDPIYENEIFIPAIGVRVPLLEPVYDSQEIIYATLNGGAVIYPDSADFGQYGNSVILGHSFNFPWLGNEYTQIFSHLDKLENGDLIRIVSNGEIFKYVITGSQTVSVKEANHIVAQSTGTNTLHLLSCWPVGSSLYRIVVSAELIE